MSFTYRGSQSSSPFLFRDAPTIRDIRQGDADDCWLLAALGAIVERRPDIIVGLFNLSEQELLSFSWMYDGDLATRPQLPGQEQGYYLDLFADSHEKSAEFVSTELPVYSWDRSRRVFAQGVDGESWVGIVEKAFAMRLGRDIHKSFIPRMGQFFSKALRLHSYRDDYGALTAGYAATAFSAITGGEVGTISLEHSHYNSWRDDPEEEAYPQHTDHSAKMWSAIREKRVLRCGMAAMTNLVFGVPSPLIAAHWYTVVDVMGHDHASGSVRLYNPHGYFEASISFKTFIDSFVRLDYVDMNRV